MINNKKVEFGTSILKNLMNNPKSNKFVKMLSYLQLVNIEKVEYTKEPCKCCVCNTRLYNIVELKKLITYYPYTETKKEVFKDITDLNKTIPKLKEFENKEQAYQFKNKDLFFCNNCLISLSILEYKELEPQETTVDIITHKRPRKVVKAVYKPIRVRKTPTKIVDIDEALLSLLNKYKKD